MNISNICTNQIFKNYVELCSTLEIPIKNGGKGKELQLEDFSRYFRYTKDKNKFIITEIFDNPLPKINNKLGGNNSKYVEHVKYLLLNKLSNCEGFRCTFTKRNLFEFLGMVNPLYRKKLYMRQKIINENDRITSFDVNNFYLRTNDKINKILFDSLKSLKNQFLIDYKEINIIVSKDLNGKQEHREASIEEIKILLEVKRKVLLDMELNSMIQVISKFKLDDFYNRVNRILKEKYDINYFYKQFELIFIRNNILQELSLIESKEKHKKELNNKVIETINLNAKNTYEKNIQEYDEFNIFNLFRYREDYVYAQQELSEYLMKID